MPRFRRAGGAGRTEPQIRHANDTIDLAERRARTEALIEAAPDAIVVAGPDGTLQEFNAAAEELTGWRREQVLGRDMAEVLVPERDRATFRAAVLDRAPARVAGGPGGAASRGRFSLRRADGRERLAELTPLSMMIDGQPITCSFIRDLSELDRAHTELRETEQRFRLMSQLAPVGIMQTDLAGRSVFTNDRWREMLGLTEEQARGAYWSDGLHPDDVGRVQQEWEQAAWHDGELRTDCRLRPAGHAESWVHLAIKPVPGEDGRPAGWLAALTNVSERKRAEALDEAKTEFLATLSHELRTPLTSIISFTELILDDTSQLPADTVDALSVIQRNGDKLLRLLGDLLLLSRLEARAIALDPGSVAVPGLVREAVRSVSATAAERGIEVTVSTQDGPLLRADLLRLQQIMDNLLSNAIKFSGRGGKVQVSARPEGQMWRIDVTDEGIGIPADELDTLFGRFVRGTNARMAGLPGTGLGLSVVKAIAELHSGRVEVASTVELGSTFSVFLPVLDQPVTA